MRKYGSTNGVNKHHFSLWGFLYFLNLTFQSHCDRRWRGVFTNVWVKKQFLHFTHTICCHLRSPDLMLWLVTVGLTQLTEILSRKNRKRIKETLDALWVKDDHRQAFTSFPLSLHTVLLKFLVTYRWGPVVSCDVMEMSVSVGRDQWLAHIPSHSAGRYERPWHASVRGGWAVTCCYKTAETCVLLHSWLPQRSVTAHTHFTVKVCHLMWQFHDSMLVRL